MIDDIAQKRHNFDSLGENYPIAEGVRVEQTTVAGVSCAWLNGDELSAGERVLIYIHGGCYSLGGMKSHLPLVSHIVNRLAIPSLFVDYGLAPEKPYPNGVNDLVDVFKEVAEINPKKKIILAGDSAGGGLIITAIPRLLDLKSASLDACVLLSPWVDLSCTSQSYDDNAKIDPILSRAGMQDFAAVYLADKVLVEANPLKRLESLFPPTLILVGSNEVLLDDSRMAYEKILKQQDKTQLSVYEGQTHVWLMDSIKSDATVSALNEIAQFIL